MPTPPPTATVTSASVRARLLEALEASLIGPFDRATGNETLPIPPSRWYLTGFLAPQMARTRDDDPTDDDELGAGDDVDDADLPPADKPPKAQQTRQFLPASIGMSVLLPPGSGGSVKVTVRWADYTTIETPPDEEQRKLPLPEGKEKRDDTGKRRTPRDRIEWMRVQKVPVVVDVPLDATALANGIAVEGSGGLMLQGKLDTTNAPGLKEGTRTLALFLVNRRQATEKRVADLAYVFQVSFELSAGALGLVARPNRQHEDADDLDDRIADLQYRGHCEYAVGHGASVRALRDDDGEVRRAITTWLPTAEVRRVETHESASIQTRMGVLASLSSAEAVHEALHALPAEYALWIAQQQKMDVGGEERVKTRDRLVQEAKRACDRIADGIQLLKTDPQVLDAFRTMNLAMEMQQRQRARSDEDKKRVPAWRLFQLAFIVMNLRAIAQPHDKDRDTAELIFFPTGGGKTEAYLGVIGFTLVLRRLKRNALPDGGTGVAVILRYTLRLLTLDQLSRAATLMCALEVIRRGRTAELGELRFAVGLWVGRKATANTLAEVSKKIIDYKGSNSQYATSPFPLTECPWCQVAVAKNSFELKPTPAKAEEVVVACVNPECPFTVRKSAQGLPVLFVDEQIYRELPSFLVSTVDKFALLPWRGEAGRLFGRVTSRENARFFGPTDSKAPKTAKPLPQGLMPPELIVQDELHLISGPLGTMVGLYETAIEELCTATIDGKRVRPKIIASTATVKRAREQIRALFSRPLTAIFPPPGVDAMETFFSKVDHTSEGRLYVGVAAIGRASKAVMHDVYNTLLASAQKAHIELKGAELGAASPVDPYMTLVGYFNALRELGGMRRLVEDQVSSRVRQLELRRPSGWKGAHAWAKDRAIGEPVELTSRESTGQIGRVKARMAKPHTAEDHVDVVLASNMISVGVDIDRLGLMVVAGQPKSTNEYIQATSRVGRKKEKPGLVVTVFNPVKPRDRSHLERFAYYHETFYRAVEATSVTPFSGPALQRGLAGVIVGMARHANAALTPSDAVMKMTALRKEAERVVDALAERAAAERRDTPDAEAEKVRTTLQQRGRNLLDAWEAIIKRANEAGADRCYSPWDPGKKGLPLLFQTTDPQPVNEDDQKFAAPSSMRDVEGSVHVWVRRGPLGGKRMS